MTGRTVGVRDPAAGIVSWDQIVAAQQLLQRHVEATPLIPSRSPHPEQAGPVYLKLECNLPTGSFKIRGALYGLWARQRLGTVSEVVAASTGNHGIATAFAGRLLGAPAHVFVPRTSNPTKCEKIRSLGASLSEVGRDITEAREAADDYADTRAAFVLDDATDPNLPAGPATIALEVIDELPDVARLIVPVGDTALIRGVATAVRARKPDVRVVGVQAEQAPAYALSWKSGRAQSTETCDTIAGGLATRTTDPANVRAIRALVDDFVLVSEQQLFEAVCRLQLEEDVRAEPAGAAALAGLEQLEPVVGPTVLLVTGGNLSPDLQAAVDARGKG